ncbi:Bacteriorhodopsin-like protein [Aspergillus sclerotialis]|uniref:Bacteriorhodopsin-like protein n=1 Tax=Aspergillus sclerotialis TaxID=2070753 RepID=A0A3A2ZKQ0_9EURO|nr:Bacteriorhodopsin-like protein [Aspergillus sclerotialis]
MATITPTIKHRPTTPLLPTSSSSVAPVPTVIPGDNPVFQEMGNTGKRTLCFIIYLALATGEGVAWSYSPLTHEHKHVPNISQDYYRQIQVLRYVNWILTTPILLVNFALLAGLPGAHLLIAVTANILMFATGLLGTFASHGAKRWVWFAISCISYLVVVYQIGVNGQKAAANRDPQTRRFFGSLVMVGMLVMAIYLVYVPFLAVLDGDIWGTDKDRTLAAGPLALRMRVNTEVILFAILDIFAQGLLGYWIIIAHDGSPGM